MPQLPITCETLGALDNGLAGQIIDAALREASFDIDDRGQDGKPRKVEIHIVMKMLKNGQVVTTVEATPKVPRRKTAETIGQVKRVGPGRTNIVFSQFAPEDPHQRTIDDVDA